MSEETKNDQEEDMASRVAREIIPFVENTRTLQNEITLLRNESRLLQRHFVRSTENSIVKFSHWPTGFVFRYNTGVFRENGWWFKLQSAYWYDPYLHFAMTIGVDIAFDIQSCLSRCTIQKEFFYEYCGFFSMHVAEPVDVGMVNCMVLGATVLEEQYNSLPDTPFSPREFLEAWENQPRVIELRLVMLKLCPDSKCTRRGRDIVVFDE